MRLDLGIFNIILLIAQPISLLTQPSFPSLNTGKPLKSSVHSRIFKFFSDSLCFFSSSIGLILHHSNLGNRGWFFEKTVPIWSLFIRVCSEFPLSPNKYPKPTRHFSWCYCRSSSLNFHKSIFQHRCQKYLHEYPPPRIHAFPYKL